VAPDPFGSEITVGAKSIGIQSPPKSKQLQSTIARALDERERRRFRHFSQHGQGFFEIKNQLLTTFGFSAACPQSRNIFAVRFFGEKFAPSGKYYTSVLRNQNRRNRIILTQEEPEPEPYPCSRFRFRFRFQFRFRLRFLLHKKYQTKSSLTGHWPTHA
jgi:hypothetical protein